MTSSESGYYGGDPLLDRSDVHNGPVQFFNLDGQLLNMDFQTLTLFQAGQLCRNIGLCMLKNLLLLDKNIPSPC